MNLIRSRLFSRAIVPLLLLWSTFTLAADPVDSLKTVLKSQPDSLKAPVLRELIIHYFQINPDSALQQVYYMKELAEAFNDSIAYIDYKSFESEYYWRRGDYNIAMEHAMAALQVAQSSDRYYGRLGSILITLGNIHLYLLNANEAIDYFRKASVNFEARGRLHSVASINNNIGVVYMDAYETRADPAMLDSAVVYFRKVIDADSIARPATLLNSFGNLGLVYLLKDDLNLSLRTFKEWEAFEKTNPNPTARAMNLGNYGKLMLKMNDTEKAISYFQNGLQEALGMGAQHEVQEYYGNLSAAYAQMGNYKAAYDYSSLFIQVKDSVFNTEKTKAVSELEARYQSEQKQQQITQLEQASIIKDLEAEQSRQFRLYLLVVVGLLLVAAGIIYSRYRLKRRTALLLDTKNRDLEALNQVKDKLFAIISHDLKSPLSSFHTVTSTLNQYYEQISPDDIKRYLAKLEIAAKSLEDQMKNLLEWSLQQISERSLKPEVFELRDMAEKLRSFFQLNLEVKRQTIYIEIEAAIHLETDKEYLQTVLRNLLSNSIKFTPVEGSIWLRANVIDNNVVIEVEDSGIGIASGDFHKLFTLESDKKSIGNSTEKGTGLGLVLVKEMIEKLGGVLSLTSELGKGTTFTIRMTGKQLKKAA
jgi:signal transduction histidine kinase